MTKRLLLLAMLFLPLAASAQTQHSCVASLPLYPGYGWEIVNCQGATWGTGGNPIATTLSSAVAVGDYIFVSPGTCAWGFASESCTITGPPTALTVTDSLGNGAVGNVSVNGTAVVWVSGIPFDTSNCIWGTCNWNGKSITINGTAYTISTIQSMFKLTLTSTAGTQTNVPYSVAAFSCTDSAQNRSITMAACIAKATVAGTDTITTSGPATTSYNLSHAVFTFRNANGVVGMDASACRFANCLADSQLAYAVPTHPINLLTTGELVFGDWNTSLVTTLYTVGGWTNLMAYSNVNGVGVIAYPGVGSFNAAYQSWSNAGNSVIAQGIAFIPGGTPASTFNGSAKVANSSTTGGTPLTTETIPSIVLTGYGANYTNSALSLKYYGDDASSCNGSGGSGCGATINFPTNALLIDYCGGSLVNQNTLTDSIGSSTWSGGSGGLTYTNTYTTDGWWTLWQNGTNGGDAYLTCSITGSTNKYMIQDILAFWANKGWPSNPVDQSGSAHTTTSSITITASAANTNAVELETARILCSTSSKFSSIDSSTPGWTLMNTDPSSYVYDFYKISSASETASIKVDLTSSATCDGMINTWATN